MLSKDEFIQMIEWAFGEEWMQQNMKQAALLFQFNHPEYPPLETLDIPNPSLSNAFFITQLYVHWLKYKNNRIENMNEPRNPPPNTDTFIARFLRFIGLQ